jgi:PBP1b-binding outer membrane lipoprotein LpoB
LNCKNKHVKFLKRKKMKKVILFFVVALAFASCAPKAAEEAPKVDSTAVVVDTTAVDTAAVDTAVTPM